MSFKANQIICLEHQNNCLYGEVIQIIQQRQLCWLRPLLLIENYSLFLDNHALTKNEIIDLRDTSDLLLPISWFRYSLDTEVVSLLSKLSSFADSSKDNLFSRRHLHQFIQKGWQVNKDKFSS